MLSEKTTFVDEEAIFSSLFTEKGRFLLHCCDPTNWRLRNIEEHPCDPGWEVGSYSVCHPTIRSKISIGTRIFDVVVKDGKGVIRSAFEVVKALDTSNSRVLYFDEYYFADDEPIELPGPYIQYRQMKLETWIEKYKQESPWIEITKRYTKYRKYERPKSIIPKSWNHNVSKTSKMRNIHAFSFNIQPVI